MQRLELVPTLSNIATIVNGHYVLIERLDSLLSQDPVVPDQWGFWEWLGQTPRLV
jgi:hypothetical protein